MTVRARARANDQLAALAALEAVVEIAMRALVATYRELQREPRADEPAEAVTAGTLVDLCGRLLAALDAHRRRVLTRRPETDPDWPF